SRSLITSLGRVAASAARLAAASPVSSRSIKVPPCGAIRSVSDIVEEPFVGSAKDTERPAAESVRPLAAMVDGSGDDPEGLAGELDLEAPVVAERVAVDLDRERLSGRHQHVRGVMRVLEVAALHVPRRAEHLPGEPP